MRLDPGSLEYRKRLAKLIMNLFDRWNLAEVDQAILLGFLPENLTKLTEYRNGQPFEDSQELMVRSGLFLGIHHSLRLLFAHDKEMVYRWVTLPNKHFKMSPLDVMKKRNRDGIKEVRRYLDSV